MTLNSNILFSTIFSYFISLISHIHVGFRTVGPINRKFNSDLFSPLNFVNRTNGSKIRAFLSILSEPSVGGGEANSAPSEHRAPLVRTVDTVAKSETTQELQNTAVQGELTVDKGGRDQGRP